MEQSQVAGVVGQSGPPRNTNAVKHGLFSYLSTGRLPADAVHIRRLMTMFRKELEAAVAERHGGITLTRAALVQSCVRHETRCQLLVKWLRAADGSLTTDQRLTILRDLGKATNDRDAVLGDLDLDGSPEVLDVAAVLDEINREQAAQDRVGRDGGRPDDSESGRGDNDAAESDCVGQTENLRSVPDA